VRFVTCYRVPFTLTRVPCHDIFCLCVLFIVWKSNFLSQKGLSLSPFFGLCGLRIFWPFFGFPFCLLCYLSPFFGSCGLRIFWTTFLWLSLSFFVWSFQQSIFIGFFFCYIYIYSLEIYLVYDTQTQHCENDQQRQGQKRCQHCAPCSRISGSCHVKLIYCVGNFGTRNLQTSWVP